MIEKKIITLNSCEPDSDLYVIAHKDRNTITGVNLVNDCVCGCVNYSELTVAKAKEMVLLLEEFISNEE